jgi:hypothetical protein
LTQEKLCKRGGTLRWGQVGDIVTTDAVQSSPAANETIGAVCDELREMWFA